jgi:hypothetical protein
MTKHALLAYVRDVFGAEPGDPDVDDGLTICTNSARMVAERFGGRVMGYWHKDNPTAALGEAEGGHDFAVVGDYLVDGWACYVDTRGPAVLHLTRDVANIERLYGDRSRWTLMLR